MSVTKNRDESKMGDLADSRLLVCADGVGVCGYMLSVGVPGEETIVDGGNGISDRFWSPSS